MTDHLIVGVGRHSETEAVYLLRLRDQELVAEAAPDDSVDTWLSERWGEDVPSSPLAGRWLHYKNAIYAVHGEASGDSGRLVVYTGSDGRVWLRPREMWDEGVSLENYSGPRFRRTES